MTENYEKKDSYKWIVLAISFLITSTFALSLQALPPIFENIMNDISLSNKQAGLLMGAYSLLGIFIPFAVAFLISKFDLKKIIITALTLIILGLFGFSLSSSYPLLLINRLISGAGATVLVVVSPLIITMFFEREKLGIAMGIFNTAVPTGTVISANLFGYLSLHMNWRTIIVGIALFATLVLTLVILALRLPQRERDDSKKNASSLDFNMGINLWLIAAIWMIANGQLLAYTTFAPKFYQSFGMSVQKSALLTSFIMFVSIFLTPIVGIVIDRTNQKRLFLIIGNTIVGLSFFFITTNILSLSTWAIGLGLGLAFVPVCIFSLIPNVVKPEQVSIGLAIVTSANNLGITLGPLGFGSLLDKTGGDFTKGFIALSLFAFVSVIISISINLKKRQSKV